MAIKGGVGDWRVSVDANAAFELVERLRENMEASGTERVAAQAALAMAEAAERAFSHEVNPRTGERWAEPAEGTVKHRGFRSLLRRTGTLESDIRTGYKLTPRGARAFINVEDRSQKIANVHMYGARGSSKSAKARKRHTTKRMAGYSLPARKFIGLAPRAVTELMDFVRTQMLNGVEAKYTIGQ